MVVVWDATSTGWFRRFRLAYSHDHQSCCAWVSCSTFMFLPSPALGGTYRLPDAKITLSPLFWHHQLSFYLFRWLLVLSSLGQGCSFILRLCSTSNDLFEFSVGVLFRYTSMLLDICKSLSTMAVSGTSSRGCLMGVLFESTRRCDPLFDVGGHPSQ